MENSNITYLISTLPEKPGVYLMKDIKNITIYVGKAVSLKNRVSSYFINLSNHTAKTRKMVSSIYTFEYIILDNERQAFLTECDLIKSLRPYYNILLKDDKSYPYIKVTVKDKYPGIYVTRNRFEKDCRYFGPFPKRVSKKYTVPLLQSAFPIRSCRTMCKRPCLNYDMHLCLAPCAGKCTDVKYSETADGLIKFLSGGRNALMDEYKEKMQNEADALNFEKAAYYRDKINSLVTISDSYSLNTDEDSTDVIAYAKQGNFISFFIMFLRKGTVSDKRTVNIRQERVEDTDVGYEFLRQYYDNNIPKRIIFSNELSNREDMEIWLSSIAGRKVEIVVPKKGKYRKLADTAYGNAITTLELFMGQIKDSADVSPIYSLACALKLETVPDVIEAYDISNLSGTDTVGAKVLFREGIPDKSGYRRYEIHNGKKYSDTDALREVLTRRMKNSDLPGLILVDGGMNQVNAIKDIVSDIPVAGMVKDSNHRTRALVYGDMEYDLNEDRNLFVFISSVQDEVHRFAITYNKKKRMKRIYESELDNIPGVGENIKATLLKHFGSVREIKAAGELQIADVKGIGRNRAKVIYEYFHVR